MKAILLAAGLGTRLGELTRHVPKCLLPICGQPLLTYWFRALERAGVEDVLINLHYHADAVRNYLSGLETPIRVTTFYEPELLGSAGTLREAWDFVADETDFYVIYADNLARVDLGRLWSFHEAAGRPVLSLLAYPTDQPERCGILEFAADGRVITFKEKPPQPRSKFANAGIHVASAALREFLPEKTPADLGFDVLPRLIGRMYGYVTDEYIQYIGTPETYAAAERAWPTQER